ncbi:hypothetical protein H5410_030208, partial [Solanum commersonii]
MLRCIRTYVFTSKSSTNFNYVQEILPFDVFLDQMTRFFFFQNSKATTWKPFIIFWVLMNKQEKKKDGIRSKYMHH